jgi:Putative bacterial sensory transduction regulator
VPRVELSEAAERDHVVDVIDAWAQRQLDEGGALIAVEKMEVSDRSASHRWLLRFKGEEKDFITLWLTFHQRTLHFETQFMPVPDENKEEVMTYLLRRNAHLYGMAFAFGPEDALYLIGRVPASLVDDDELDRIAGSSLIYVDDHFPTAMSLGFPTLYRRKPRR